MGMICLVCSKCGKTWYTASTRCGQKCDDCDGELIEKKSKVQIKEEEKKRN
jgi:hypothetical protein